MIDKLNAITVIDDLFTASDCDELVNYFLFNASGLRYNEETHTSFLPIVPHTTNQPVNDFIASKVIKAFNVVGDNVRIQRAHVEHREAGNGMDMHFDTTNSTTVFTSVTYLNEGYEGGKTIIRPSDENSDRYDTYISPRVGRTVFYNGVLNLHGVTEILGTARITMPIWYCLQPSDLPHSLKWWNKLGG